MKMDNPNVHGSDGPEIEAPLLLRYLVKKYDELLESEHPRISVTLGGLSLTGVSHDKDNESELWRILYPASHPDQDLLRRCREIFLRTLARTEEGQTCEPSGNERGFPSLDERTSRQILVTALREGRKMIDEEAYEFCQIVRVLGWISLQCYPRRLAEFEDAWQCFEEAPGEATRLGVEVLRTAFRRRDRED